MAFTCYSVIRSTTTALLLAAAPFAMATSMKLTSHMMDSLRNPRYVSTVNERCYRSAASSRRIVSSMAAFISHRRRICNSSLRYPSRFLHSDNKGDKTTYDHESKYPLIIAPMCKVADALISSMQLLEEQSIPEPQESALHLLSCALDLDWETGYREMREILEMAAMKQTTDFSMNTLAMHTLTSDQSNTYKSMLERRCRHEPIQYIVGKWDFHMLSGLIIKKPMLCPRPETEELVELVLNDVTRLIEDRRDECKDICESKSRIRILDVGAGTGAIGIALANQFPNDVQVISLDVLPEAVELSNQNAEKFLSPLIGHEKVKELYQAILCSAKDFTNISPDQTMCYDMGFDVVVSNPPYIPAVDMTGLSLDVLSYESHRALCGGDDGLNVIRDIVERLPEWSNGAHSQQKYCWMEVDDSHPKLIEKWLASGSDESIRLRVEYCECYQDFCGRDRFVKLRVT